MSNSVLQTIKENFTHSHRRLISFEEFLDSYPIEHLFRNIFNVVSEMVEELVGNGIQEYPNDPESINYVDYNLENIFEHGQVDPFFSDRLFANRFVSLFNTLDKGSTQNKIYVFRGPPGSGKSTFLNCFTNKVQEYVNEGNGTMYEVVWKLNNKLTIPCPSHDNPLLLIPKDRRKEVISELLKNNKELRDEIFSKKRFEWIFTSNPCTFCSSISQSLADKHGDILPYLYVRQYRISKNLSEGISVFNANDEFPKFKAQPTEKIQEKLDEYFEEEGGGVKIDHSIYAKSNNGIYALMDLKDNNHYRFVGLRGIVSEGRHKVKTIEEKVKSIFLIVTNPEDEKEIVDSAMEDRKHVTKMNYVLVPKTQNKIFYKIYGESKKERFHPNVVDMFSRVLISTRMNKEKDNNVILTWVDNSSSYGDICDEDLLILRQEVYNGIIPEWLSETDIQNFVYDIRKGIINMALNDGKEGISDRKAIEIFGNLLNYYVDDEYIGIKRVKNYFERVDTSLLEYIPKGFLDAVERYYTYIISQEVKESLFIRNDEKIKKDLKNYLFSLNFSVGDRLTNPHTSDTFIVSDELFRKVEKPIFGTSNEHIRDKVFKRYISETVCCENIEESQQFKKLYQDYVYGLKEHILKEFIDSKNFRNAIKDYDTSYFNSYDNKIRRNVNNLIENMTSNYGYTIKAAKEVCTYLFDKLE